MRNTIFSLFFIVLNTLLFAQDSQIVDVGFNSNARISSEPIIENGVSFFGNDNGMFYALDVELLKLKWKFETPSMIRSKAIIINEIVYFKSGNFIYALNKKTGAKIWSFSVSDSILNRQLDLWDYHSGSPVVYKEKIFFGFNNGLVFGLSLDKGDVETKFSSDSLAAVRSGLVISKDILYFGDWKGKVYAYDLKTNKRLWKYDSYEKQIYETFGQINTELIVENELLYFGARNPEFQVIDVNTASKKWSFVEKEGGWISGDPLIHNDTLFITGSDNHKLIAFNPQNGERYWEFEFLFNSFSKPLVYKDFIFITSGDAYSVYGNGHGFGYLYALNRADGRLINFSLIGGNLNSSPVIHNDKLFVNSEDGFVYKVDIEKFLNPNRSLIEKGYNAFQDVKVNTKISGAVNIEYILNYDAEICISITDLSGNTIRNLFEGVKKKGVYKLNWDLLSDSSKRVDSGYYFVEITSGETVIKSFFKTK